MRKLILTGILAASLNGACGAEKDSKEPTTVKYRTEGGGHCVHQRDDKTTLCYDSSGALVAVSDPNGVFKLHEFHGIDRIDQGEWFGP